MRNEVLSVCPQWPVALRSVVAAALILTSWNAAILAQTAAVPVAQTASSAPSDALQEIVVTAEKRESTVQKTPISITAISGDVLAAQGITNMLEVAEETPGVSFRTAGPGQTEFEVRGLASSGGATATVGYYLDETPISPPALGAIGKIAIDPNLYDINRVEVLRGPQGTLYGAGSMGGTIKIITNTAKLNTTEAAADGTVSKTGDNGGTNWGANALVNVPLVTDKAALRLVVSTSLSDGWIDRIVVSPFPFPSNTGCTPTIFLGCARGDVLAAPVDKIIPRTNWSRLDTARMNLVIQPNGALKINATAIYQRTQTGGSSTFDSPPGTQGPLAHYQPFDTAEPSSDYVRLASLVVSYDFAGAELTSATTYWNRSLSQSQEPSESFQNLYYTPTFYPNEAGVETDVLKQFGQELRLSSTGADPFQWLVGTFYSNLKTEWDQTVSDPVLTNAVYASGLYLPVTVADNPQGLIYVGRIPYTMKQYAGFAEVSYRLEPSLRLSLGGRYYNYDSEVHASQAGIFTQSVSAVPTIVNSTTQAGGFNPKINLSYTPNDDLTVYGTVAKGFRPGGINLPLPSAGPNSCTAALQAIGVTSQTTSYDADSVWSYEVGEKAKLNDGRLTLNGSLYYIRWNDIQQLVPLACGYFFTVNAGQARSYGSEVEFRANVTQRLSLDATGAYTNATINSPNPTLGIAPGTPILNIPKYTASAAAQYLQPLRAGLRLSARLTATYTGSITDEAYTYVKLPGYTLLDARIGVLADRWTVYLSGTNLTNKVAELTANNTSFSFNSPALTRITSNQPRTIGISVSAKF